MQALGSAPLGGVGSAGTGLWLLLLRRGRLASLGPVVSGRLSDRQARVVRLLDLSKRTESRAIFLSGRLDGAGRKLVSHGSGELEIT